MTAPLVWTYFIGLAFSLMPITRAFLRTEGWPEYDDLDPEDYAMAIGMGLVFSFFWPLVIVGFVMYRMLKPKAKPVNLEKS